MDFSQNGHYERKNGREMIIILQMLLTLLKKTMQFILLILMEYFSMTGIRGINKSRKSRKLYGGLNNNDFLLIKEMKDRNKLIILEYNSFDYPTAQIMNL